MLCALVAKTVACKTGPLDTFSYYLQGDEKPTLQPLKWWAI